MTTDHIDPADDNDPYDSDEIIDPEPLKAQGNHSLARLMFQVYRNFNSGTHQKYAERGYAGMTLAHTLLMANMETAGIRIVALAERIGLTKQFTGRLVQEMEQRRFLTTEPDPKDKRATIVKPTQRGWRYLRDACQVKDEMEASFALALGAERMAELVASINDLAALRSAEHNEALDQIE